jgi:selenocysteine-specific elongation factor
VIVDPRPKGRHKRFSNETLSRLEALSQGTPAEILFQALAALGSASLREVIARSNLEAGAAGAALTDLVESGQLVAVEEPPGGMLTPKLDLLVTSRGHWENLAARVQAELENYHRAHPLRRGMPKEELKSRLKIAPRLFNAGLRRLISAGIAQETGPLIHRPEHAIRFSSQQQQLVESLLDRFADTPYAPPSAKDSQAQVGEDIFAALLETSALVAVAPDVVFRRADYERLVSEVRRLLEQRGTVTAAEVRDHFNTSRRYALALLEHMDSLGITVREGDARRLRK